MTIALGFCVRDGVLLCADTELNDWAMKLHDTKIVSFLCPGGTVAFAYAGNTDIALAAIQKCREKLQHVSPEHTFGSLRSTLSKEYKSHVASQDLDYRFLIALYFPPGRVQLFSTKQTTIREITNYECIGAGDSLAHYLIRPSFNMGVTEDKSSSGTRSPSDG